MSDLTKECNKCHRVLNVNEFGKQPNSPDGLRYACLECQSKRWKEYYQTNLQTQRARDRKRYPTEREMRSNSHYKRKYGISLEDYQALLSKQNGVCAICHKPETVVWKGGEIIPLAVDHCHKTGKVRGLLCNRCNRTLALFDDDIEIMQSAINYLKH